jgi:toxin HigB-1
MRMISRFRHKGLERFYLTGDTRGIDLRHAAWLRILLTALDAASGPGDLSNPGFGLHPLKGKRKGQWSVWVSGNWRVVFGFAGSNVTNVDLVDYH